MTRPAAPTSDEMIKGTGAHLLVKHLEQLVAQAELDLPAAPDHRRLYVVTLRSWIRSANSEKKLELNRQHDAGFNIVKLFGGPLPAPSDIGMTAEEIRARARLLQHHDWLIPVVAGVYRPAAGKVFGVGR